MNKTIGSEKYRDLVSWLKSSRTGQDLTQRDLSKLLNKPRSYVAKIELMERKLDVREYVIYCQVLDIEPEIGLNFLK